MVDLSVSGSAAETMGREPTRSERALGTERLAWLAHDALDERTRAAAQTQLVELNACVARAVAARYRGRGVPLDDLEQVACEGLVKAVRRFDPTRHHDFLSYAVPTIRGEVLRYFRDSSWMVRPPRRLQELQWRIRGAVADLSGRLGREPTPEEICEELGISSEAYDEAAQAFGCFQPRSLDEPVSEDVGTPVLGDRLVTEPEHLDAAEARAMLTPLVHRLSDRDQRILYLRFFEDQTQQEIGEELGVAQMQVSRWLSKILSALRSQLEDEVAEAG